MRTDAGGRLLNGPPSHMSLFVAKDLKAPDLRMIPKILCKRKIACFWDIVEKYIIIFMNFFM
jgi:hypothetical protein